MWPFVLGGAVFGYLVGRERDKAAPTEQPQQTQTRERLHCDDYKSPISGVTGAQWTKFMRAVGDKSNARNISSTGHLGFFRFSYPRLAEIGLVVRPHRAPGRDGKSVWTGDFVPPLTMAGFLKNVGLQCRAFALSSGDFATHIRESHARDLGKEIGGSRATLSGLLAVLHRAGHKGFDHWVVSKEDQKKYPNTTAAYKAANGIF